MTKPGSSQNGGPVHRPIAPSLVGMPVHLRRGEEGWRIRDFDVEIAQSTAFANPELQSWFSGASGAGLVALRKTDYGGAFDATLFDAARLSLDAAVERGTTIPLGYGPSLTSEAGSVRTLQFVTIR